ncbi:hypothetical protein BGX31_005932 [Mortierella sp. GBA43]|nr:hypothetical protein BGX31_005932 [Mortierella sp. GBA43]
MQASTWLHSTHFATSTTTKSSRGELEAHTPPHPQSSASESVRLAPTGPSGGNDAPLVEQIQDNFESSIPVVTSTYQGRTSINDYAVHSALEPAPFPRDLHLFSPSTAVESPKSPSQGTHSDLESFEDLDHNTASALYRGTLFEYQTQEVLKKCLGIYTLRTAGSNDLGIDLRGTWFLPLSASPKPGDMVRHLKVIVQCKTTGSKIGPKYVRELQGSLSYESQPTMAILASSSEFTKQALLPYAKSLWPMALVVIDTETQQCRKLMWNRAAEKVMYGVQVGTQWALDGQGGVQSRPVLCFEGKVIERLPGPHLNESPSQG